MTAKPLGWRNVFCVIQFDMGLFPRNAHSLKRIDGVGYGWLSGSICWDDETLLPGDDNDNVWVGVNDTVGNRKAINESPHFPP